MQKSKKNTCSNLSFRFWIAGEDHDFEEINHVYIHKNASRLKKIAIDDELESKKSISSRVLPKQETATFLKDIFSTFQETEHTKKIYQKLQEAADQSETYVDFLELLFIKCSKKKA